MKSEKIFFVYPIAGSPDEYYIESLWAEKFGEYFKVDNIPFYIKNIAVGDVVSAEFDEEEKIFYFDELVKASGNSVIRIVPSSMSKIDTIGSQLVALGCHWESMKDQPLIAVHIPKEVSYEKVKSYLDTNTEIFDYEEACLGWK
jgi:hypothetical protein